MVVLLQGFSELCYPHHVMSGAVLDGKTIGREIQEELRPRIAALASSDRPPSLAVLLVGDNPASQIYVRNKIAACRDLGIRSVDLTPPARSDTSDLVETIRGLNQDPSIDGILVQTPLPQHVDAHRVLLEVDPSKDADGFHPCNVGNLVANNPGPRACTPAGIMELLSRSEIAVAGQHAVVIGRSDIVGKPMALMLLHANATVTMCHSKTRNLPEICRQADILVAAIGKPALVTADYLKPGAVVVDVGMNRVSNEAEVVRLFPHESSRLGAYAKNGHVLVGDVEPMAAQAISSAYTPVPGGVGPLTIAMLMANTVALAEKRLLGTGQG
jgi:methylenetetrahydrofolate dehydrogenase (NADP+)/methenyltetrahydrofolate cyclohydrolase